MLWLIAVPAVEAQTIDRLVEEERDVEASYVEPWETCQGTMRFTRSYALPKRAKKVRVSPAPGATSRDGKIKIHSVDLISLVEGSSRPGPLVCLVPLSYPLNAQAHEVAARGR
jgi:hypothetical protein